MEFRLGASLWNNVTDSQAQTPARQPTSGFNQKLQLPAQELQKPNNQSLPKPADAHSPDSLWQLTQLPLSQHKGAVRAELYGWGALAGHHLSQVDGQAPSVAERMATTQAVASAVAPMGATALVAPTVRQAVATTLSSRPQSVVLAQPPAEAGQSAPAATVGEATGELSSFFLQRWPERRLLLLPRGNGVDVVVRDFHLSTDEQQAVAADLRRFIQQSGSSVEQVWVNGRRVWQR